MRLLRYLGILLVFGACEPETLPPEEIGTPELVLAASRDGEPLRLEAGQRGWYLATERTYDAENELYAFHGSLENPENDDAGGFELVFYDKATRAQGSSVPASDIFAPGRYSFANTAGAVLGYKLVLNARAAGENPRYTWFQDGQEVETASSFVATSSSPYDAIFRVEVVRPDGCRSELSQRIEVPASECEVDFSQELQADGSLLLRAETAGIADPTYNWEVSGAPASTQSELRLPANLRGSLGVCLNVTEGDCRSQRCKNLNLGGISSCAVNFDADIETLRAAPPLGRVALRWTDAEGRVYSSLGERQPAESFFELLAAEPYRENREGQPTYQLIFRASARLFWVENDTARDSMDWAVERAVWAVAY